MISMKPIKLTLSAFGPYSDIEIIDFDLLKDHSIFVITGKTGSGKTTIFDGICYALYGFASGSDRDGESLRSHFSPEDRLTYVELEFHLRGERYYIKRIPKQTRPVKIGEGYTEQKPEAELKLPDGKTITGIEKVNSKIISLLGINYNQFKQIVMIAQGEFRELILADSKSREGIFRKIFGTHQFQAIQDTLDKKSKDLRKELSILEQNEEIFIKNIDFGDREELKAMINAENININGIIESLDDFIKKERAKDELYQLEIKKLEKELDRLNTDLIKGIEVNNLFKEKDDSKELFLSLEQNIKKNEEKEENIKCGRKALAIKASEDNHIQRYNFMKIKEKELEDAKLALDKAQKNHKKAEEILLKEKARENNRQELFESLTILKKDKNKVLEYDKRNIELYELKKIFQEKSDEKNKSKAKIEELKKKEELLQENLIKSQKAALEHISLTTKLEKLEDSSEKLVKLEEEHKTLEDFRNKYTKEKAKLNAIEKEYHESKKAYERLNDLFLRGQAGLLARELVEGKPCPVCGAKEHPYPAPIMEGTPSESKLKTAKEIFAKNDEAYKDSLNKLTEQNTKGKAQVSLINGIRKELLIKYENIPEIDDESFIFFIKNNKEIESKEIKALKDKILESKKLKDLESKLTLTINEIKSDVKKEEEILGKLNLLVIEQNAAINNLKQKLVDIEKDLPDGIRTIEDMEKMIKNKEKQLSDIDGARKNAEESFKNAEKQLTATETELSEKTKVHKSSIEEYKLSEEKLDKDMLNAGFLNIEDYKASKISEGQIEQLEKEVKEFYGSLKSAKDRYEKALKSLKDLKIVDILEIKQKISSKRSQKENEEEQGKRIYARLEKNKELQAKLEGLKKKILVKEEEYKKISYLSEMAKGNNAEKLSFERYVLAAYFDDIIIAANARLKKMTDGRFELSRIKEKQKGGAQQGLDLEVYDYYTGKARHVKVMSGGEGFKASLSLALGLSDVIQQSSGGVSIETMFIDEGFGSLDPESLEKSVECLVELQQSGKFVGVISHVPELKERIKAGIEITSDISGSKATIAI